MKYTLDFTQRVVWIEPDHKHYWFFVALSALPGIEEAVRMEKRHEEEAGFAERMKAYHRARRELEGMNYWREK